MHRAVLSVFRVTRKCRPVRFISSTLPRHSLDEFFDNSIRRSATEWEDLKEREEAPEEKLQLSDKDLKFGRTWEVEDLESLKSPVLHSLWFVLLKERNRCLTADAYCRQELEEASWVYLRLKSVQQSMENLQFVIEERERQIDEAKTVLWMRRVGNLLGEEYARELAATYTQYTLPHTQKEQEQMKKMKHHQLFTKEFNRVRQPYDSWQMKMEMEQETDEWEAKKANYESDEYIHEDDFVPGLEGFLHNIKREDWEKLEATPDQFVESRVRREEDRAKIINRIHDERVAADTEAELKNLQRWKNRVEGNDPKD